MNLPVIRPGFPGDRSNLEDLQRRASFANDGDREALLANPDAIHLPKDQLEDGRVSILSLDDVIVAFALFVDPPFWGQGLGRLLIENAAQIARDQGAKYLYVIGNPHAKGFYEKCGFEFQSACQTKFGSALTMRLTL